MKPKVLLTHKLPAAWIDSIRDIVELIVPETDDLFERIAEVEGVFSLLSDPFRANQLEKATKLKVISNMAVGFDNIDVTWCTRHGIAVGNTPGVLTDSTADISFGLIIAASRNFHEANIDASEGKWFGWSPTGWLGMELAGKTLGIYGMGKIGQAVARRAVGFGMNVIYHNRKVVEDAQGVKYVSFSELVTQSDVLSLHCPLTEETKGVINAEIFHQMKRTAILVNTARGKVIDQVALVEALKAGTIAAAGLDVTDPEPLPMDHELFKLKNCFVVPHIGTSTHEARQKMAKIACENLLAGLAGERLPFCVNPEVYLGKR